MARSETITHSLMISLMDELLDNWNDEEKRTATQKKLEFIHSLYMEELRLINNLRSFQESSI